MDKTVKLLNLNKFSGSVVAESGIESGHPRAVVFSME
jgi:hypothetical protein